MPKRTKKVLWLEAKLDDDPDSHRRQKVFMQELFNTFGGVVDFEPHELRTVDSLDKLLNKARKSPYDLIHLVAHGKRTKRTTYILTSTSTNERIDLLNPEIQSMFSDLQAEALYFSCCSIGQNQKLMSTFVKLSNADGVFASVDKVTDYQAFLIEPIFYHLMYGWYHGKPADDKILLPAVYQRLRFSMDYLGIDEWDSSQDPTKDPLVYPLLTAEFSDSAYGKN